MEFEDFLLRVWRAYKETPEFCMWGDMIALQGPPVCRSLCFDLTVWFRGDMYGPTSGIA
jgi:hypothetical protein